MGKQGLCVLRRGRDSTSGNLHKKSVRENVQRCLFANRLSFSELFDDISLMLKVRRLCVVVDSLISAAKVCDCVTSAWCWQLCDVLFRQNSLGKLNLGLVSAGSIGTEPVFVQIRWQFVHYVSFCLLSIPCEILLLSDREKSSVLLAIEVGVELKLLCKP